jgi:hypothetical protein
MSSDMQKIDLQLRNAIIYLGVVSTTLVGSLGIVLITAPVLVLMVPPAAGRRAIKLVLAADCSRSRATVWCRWRSPRDDSTARG